MTKSIFLSALMCFAFSRVAMADDGLSAVFHDSSEVITTNGYKSSETLADFPLLLRISESNPKGFSYALAGDCGARLRFEHQSLSASGEVSSRQTVPFEVEKWDTNGTSFVWVRHPALTSSSTSRIVMFWNQREGTTIPVNRPQSVWEGSGTPFGAYASVWHLTGGVAGSTANPFVTEFPDDFTEVDGAVVKGRRSVKAGRESLALSLEPNGTVSSFTNSGCTVTMWLKLQGSIEVNGAWLYALNRSSDGSTALMAARFSGGTASNATELTVYPGSSGCPGGVRVALGDAIAADTWTKIDVVHGGQYVQVFVDGVSSAGKLTYAGHAGSARVSLDAAAEAGVYAHFDEIRVYPGVAATADKDDLRGKLEAKQVGESCWSFGLLMKDGLRANSWVSEPFMTKTAWRNGDVAGEVTNGVPTYGESVITYRNRITGETYDEMPTASGEYSAVATVDQGSDYTSLVKEIDFSIAAISTTHDSGYASAYDFAGRMTFEVTDYPEDSGVLKDFPMLVRIAPGRPKGFRYSLLPHGQDDVRFFDTNGKSLNYEFDTWNTNGESLVWVSVPTYSLGAKVTMCWGLLEGCELTAVNPEKVWSAYTGVWHFSEDIPAASAGTAKSADSTGNGLDAAPSASSTVMKSESGKVGNARRISNASTVNGRYLSVTGSEELELGGDFTVSGWVKFNGVASTEMSSVLSRGSGWSIADWYSTSTQIPLNHKAFGVYGAGTSKCGIVQASTSSLGDAGWVYFSAAYSGTNVLVRTISDAGSWVTTNVIDKAADNGSAIAIGGGFTSRASLNGLVDEFRLIGGTESDAAILSQVGQMTNRTYYSVGSFTNDSSAVLQNGWVRMPSMTATVWSPLNPPTGDDIDLGEANHGLPTVRYIDRTSGMDLGDEMPTAVGEYRAVITVPEEKDGITFCYSGLTAEIAFRIVVEEVSHDLGEDFDRVLLMNDDYTVDDGIVQAQGYDEETSLLGAPYWRHLDANGYDASTGDDIYTTSKRFNFGGGTHHFYVSGDGEKLLWYLGNVRFGNTFDNGWYYPGETETTGLQARQNYLPWNHESLKVVYDDGDYVYGFHEFAGQAVLQNKVDSQIASGCFEKGVGTVYFDAVNGWNDNVLDELGYGNYRLVVEVSTNALNSSLAPTDERVASTYERNLYDDSGKVTNTVTVVYDPVAYAEWHQIPMHVIRFDGAEQTDEGVAEELTLAITNGASYSHFYRVYAPVNVRVPARIRIRRTAIDPTQSLDPDGEAYILVDNVICSKPASVVELKPYGELDSTKTGKAVLGYEAALVPAFPCPADAAVRGRAKGVMADGSTLVQGVVSAASMHYRWHYLNQQATDWKTVDLDPSTLVARNILELPGLPGDIEFWFDATQNGQFYTYADYSGLGLYLGDSDYSERVGSVTNRAAAWSTQGDWFVRLREGKAWYSDMKLLVKTSEDATPEEVDMLVSGNDMWRGFYRMKEQLDGGIIWRIEPRNLQTDGSTEWNRSTNRWYLADYAYGDETQKTVTFPIAGRLAEGGAGDWSVVPCDAATGYLMFQVDDTSRGVTIIHADYQDFNNWNDAAGEYFVGSSTEDGQKKGVSADVREYGEKYAGWADEVATNKSWSLIFDKQLDTPDFPGYTTFSSKKGYFDAWDLGEGRYVYGKYRELQSNVAFEMVGGGASGGRGYVEMSRNTQLGSNWPRGFGTVSFKARLAQAVNPAHMAYYEEGSGLTDYAFYARACFDMKANTGFSGAASVSLFSYYRPSKGCYEARWEQVEGKVETQEEYAGKVLSPAEDGQRLAIYRWNLSGVTYVPTLLFAVTNSAMFKFEMPTMSGSVTNNLLPMCISTYAGNNNDTVIVAGVRCSDRGGKGGVGPEEDIGGQYWYFITYRDSSADRLVKGSYGLQSANCEGMFLTPEFGENPTWPGSVQTKEAVPSERVYTRTSLSNESKTKCVADIADDCWAAYEGREKAFYNKLAPTAYNFGFTYSMVAQTVDVYTNAVNYSGSWENEDLKLCSVVVDGFGNPGDEADYTENCYLREDSSIHIATGGTLDDPGSDVAIYDVIVKQWRGRDNWSTSDDDWNFNTGRQKSSNNYGRTNIVFTTGWVEDGMVELSAKRTQPGVAASVRSPLLDGYDNRGQGLGMIQITYREPSENIRLKVQIITNYTYSSTALKTMSQSVEEGDGNRSTWHTVTNLTYRELWEDVVGKGETATYRCSLGLHGVRGMMRIAIDDDLAREVAGETDPAKFGSILITQVECCDEPPLDKGCWWGWNVRTVGEFSDKEKRMYLPDCGADPAYLGKSVAINNSTTADVDPTITDSTAMSKHMPFVQSPTFTNGVIGQVSFKARKYDASPRSPDAVVTVYGTSKNPDNIAKDTDWTKIESFTITNTVYTTFFHKMDGNNDYRAIRFAITGVPGVSDPGPRPAGGNDPVRVLLDEVSVSEAVKAMLAFRNVGAFRHNLKPNVYQPGVTTKDEQPMCGENWGVQAELFATMLEDEIDRSQQPEVVLHWYVGTDLWGYENWKDVKKDGINRGSAKLAETEGTNFVYRSSYEAAIDAVMKSQDDAPTVVQYMLEARYWVKNSYTGKTSPVTNWLDSASWTTPSWYAPVDYNANNSGFAAYTILDTVAPGWAWINEVNVLGTGSADSKFQYVELCVPAEADITGWTLRLLSPYQNGEVMTNECATFISSGRQPYPTGTNPSGTKTRNMHSKKTFRAIGNYSSDRMKYDNGSLDGIWTFSEMDSIFYRRDGVYQIETELPFGVQLVRASGVIEDSVVTIGTNYWGRLPGTRGYDPTNAVKILNAGVPGSKFRYVAEDCCGTGYSGSVTAGGGSSTTSWANDWACSPGFVNTNYLGDVQSIDPDHPTPQGDRIIVYASVDTSFGHIYQLLGEGGARTTEAQMIILEKGSGRGTNIVYEVDPWFELKSVTTNEVNAWNYGPRVRRWEFKEVGKGASNNISVVATAQVDSDLRSKYDLTEKNPYTPAVMAWLLAGKTLKDGDEGTPFAHPGEIAPLADYIDMADNVRTNLTLTQMYWLDMDPTVSNLALKAGMIKIEPYEHPIAWQDDGEAYAGVSTLTNRRMTVFMAITNRLTHETWTPYVLRGLDPGYTSLEYETEGSTPSPAWTSVTFKVTGILANGYTRESNLDNWIPLRWFVFHRDSFYQPEDEAVDPTHKAFTSDIEIVDPYSISSPGSDAGWYQWCHDPDHPERANTPIFNRWSIDERLKPVGVEVLEKNNWFPTEE